MNLDQNRSPLFFSLYILSLYFFIIFRTLRNNSSGRSKCKKTLQGKDDTTNYYVYSAHESSDANNLFPKQTCSDSLESTYITYKLVIIVCHTFSKKSLQRHSYIDGISSIWWTTTWKKVTYFSDNCTHNLVLS